METWTQRLGDILSQFGCQTGTLHRTLPDGETLALVSQIGLPDFLLDRVALIPFGKGIAGAAAERREPVELCNLQQDLGGIAKPDARATGVSGSLAVPVFSPDTDRVIGTLGIGMAEPYEFTLEEKRRLEGIARAIAVIFENKGSGDD